jgi:hypothetical protein
VGLILWYAARGAFVWAVSTGVLRLLPSAWTHRPEWTFLISAAASGVGLTIATLVFLRRLSVQDRLPALIVFVASQMVLDALVTLFFRQVLPNFAPDHAHLFGAFVLWCYAVMLTTGAVAMRPRSA